MDPVERAVPGFRPSVHGFRFANRFPAGPTLRLAGFDPRVLGFGDASAGLCGGMALTVRDLYAAGVAVPADTEPPANGSPRFRALVRRQVESLDWFRVPLRYLDLQALRPDAPGRLERRLASVLHREPARVETVLREWPRIRAEIDAGRPAVVGLVRTAGLSPWALTQNHQVLAFAYAAGPGAVTIRVYDPNHPRDDEVRLELAVRPAAEASSRPVPLRDRVTLRQSTGEPLLGWFVQPYPTPRTLRAWR